MTTTTAKPRRRGQTLILFASFITLLMGFSALAFDVVYLFLIREHAVAAADAAALAGIRAVEQGQDVVTQVVTRTFNGNFPSGTLLVSNVSTQAPVVTPVAAGSEVSFSASVEAPTVFARWLGKDSFTINVRSTAVRRSRNVVLALDTTLSIGNDFGELKTAAKAFIDEFDDNLDRVGLVVFARSASVVVPPQTNFQVLLKSEIDNLGKEYGTGSPEGMIAAHNALLALPADGRPNDIVWFTDGRANTCRLEANVRTGAGADRCSTSPIKGLIGIQALSNHPFSGWIAELGAVDPALGVRYTQPIPECVNVSNKRNAVTSFITPYSDPTADPTMGLNGGLSISLYRPDSMPNLSNDSNSNMKEICRNWTMNLADELRLHSTLNEFTMHAIGYKNVWADDLKAIVNHQTSGYYDPNYPSGLYEYTDDAGQLVAAFRRVASSIGRLTQ